MAAVSPAGGSEDSSVPGTTGAFHRPQPRRVTHAPLLGPPQPYTPLQHVSEPSSDMNYKKSIIGAYEKAQGPGEAPQEPVDSGLDTAKLNGDASRPGPSSYPKVKPHESTHRSQTEKSRPDMGVSSQLGGLSPAVPGRRDLPGVHVRPDLALMGRPDFPAASRPEQAAVPSLGDRPQSRSSSRGFRLTGKSGSPRPATDVYAGGADKERIQQLMNAQQQLLLQQRGSAGHPSVTLASNSLVPGVTPQVLQQPASSLSRDSAAAVLLQQQLLAQQAQVAQNLDYARLLQQYQQSAAMASGLNYLDFIRQQQALSNLTHYQQVLAQYSRAWDEAVGRSGSAPAGASGLAPVGGGAAAGAALASGPSLGASGNLSQVQATLEQQLILEQRQRLEREKQRQEHDERDRAAAAIAAADRDRRQLQPQGPGRTDNTQQVAAMVDEHFEESLRLAQEKTQGAHKWSQPPGAPRAASEDLLRLYQQPLAASAGLKGKPPVLSGGMAALQDAHQQRALLEQHAALNSLTKEDGEKIKEIYTRILRQMEETSDAARQHQLTQQYQLEVARLVELARRRTMEAYPPASRSQAPASSLPAHSSTLPGHPAELRATLPPVMQSPLLRGAISSASTSQPVAPLKTEAGVKAEQPFFDLYGTLSKTKTEQAAYGRAAISPMPGGGDFKPSLPQAVKLDPANQDSTKQDLVKQEPIKLEGRTGPRTDGSITQGRPLNYPPQPPSKRVSSTLTGSESSAPKRKRSGDQRTSTEIKASAPSAATPSPVSKWKETIGIPDFQHFVEQKVTELLHMDDGGNLASSAVPVAASSGALASVTSAAAPVCASTAVSVSSVASSLAQALPSSSPNMLGVSGVPAVSPHPAASSAPRLNGEALGSDSDTRSAVSPATSARSDGAVPSPSCVHTKLKKAWLQQYGCEDEGKAPANLDTPSSACHTSESDADTLDVTGSLCSAGGAAGERVSERNTKVSSNGAAVPVGICGSASIADAQTNGAHSDSSAAGEQSTGSVKKGSTKRPRQAEKGASKRGKVEETPAADNSPLPPPNQPARKRPGPKKRNKEEPAPDAAKKIRKQGKGKPESKNNGAECASQEIESEPGAVPVLHKDPGSKYAINAQKALNRTRSPEQLQASGERFVQEWPCVKLGPKLMKCRECRLQNKRPPSSELHTPAGVPNIFCRFYAFRWLKYNAKKQIVAAGFSAVEDADTDDLDLWRPSLPVMSPPLERDTARYILQHVGSRFCELVTHERAAHLYTSKDQMLWKRAVQGVREMCDVCDSTIFNLHWTCHKCGFVTCPDCYISKHKTTNGKDGDDLRWLTCNANRQPHEPEKMMPCQIITNNCLWEACALKHELCKREALPLECVCRSAQKPNGLSKLSVNTSRSSDGKSDYDPNSPLALLADAALNSSEQTMSRNSSSSCTSEQINFTAPHQWLGCSRKPVLHLTERAHQANLALFQRHWTLAQPVLVSGCLPDTAASSWRPEALTQNFGSRDVTLIDSCTGHSSKQQSSKFWAGFACPRKRGRDSAGHSLLLRLQEWPEAEEVCEALHTRVQQLLLPLGEYTRRDGSLNLVSRLPDFFVRPDLGPRLSAAYGSSSAERPSWRGLRLLAADTVCVLVHSKLPEDERRAAVKTLESCGVTGRDLARVADSGGSEGPCAGAVWHVYSPEDHSAVTRFLNKTRQEQNLPKDAPLDDWLYLDPALRQRLSTEAGVTPRVVVQCRGEALCIPAGSMAQMRYISSCVHVWLDFVSAEHVGTSLRLAASGTPHKAAHELQIKNVIYHSVKDALAVLSQSSAAASPTQSTTQPAAPKAELPQQTLIARSSPSQSPSTRPVMQPTSNTPLVSNRTVVPACPGLAAVAN